LFWLWFAVNASVVSVALGAVIVGLGVSLRQAVLATLIGVALSFLPLGLGTLAGKWSGQPTMVVSRATFGTVGNLIPALLAVVTRLAWAAALLWMLGVGVTEVLVGSALVGNLGRVELTIGAASVGLVVAALVAGFGFGLIAVVSAIVSVISAVLVVGLIVLTASYVDLDAALALPDGDWMLLVSGAVLVFSVVGLAWANSSGDVARYQAKGTYGSSAVFFAAFGATIPAFLLISWGALLAASNSVLAEGLAENPIDLVARMLPLWYPAPLVAAVALSLISAAALALYSGGFAVLATGLRASRPAGVVISIVVTGALLAALIVVVPNAAALFGDVVTTLAVPVAAWAGIFGAETMIRTRRVHSPSLLRSRGVYPVIRWVNTVMLLVITGVGWGLSTATLAGLEWQGYLFTALGIDLSETLATSDPGVVVALVLGLLTPIVAGIPALRALQRAELAANEADHAANAASGGRDASEGVPTDASLA
jgi:purine-cytosine permease-like protein